MTVTVADRCPLKQIGKYEILRELGRGAMGVVYQARDPLIGRLVAIKTITSGLASGNDQLQRFQREAKAAGALRHTNIVTIYELGFSEGAHFLVMEYIEGEGLDLLIQRGEPATFIEKFSYLMQLCRALHHAHENGIVHRDVKPANVVVTTDGIVKVVDFGIARLMDGTHTQTGALVGTLAYMSPEQLKGKRADERSDIWAVGVLAYELISGRKPFQGDNHGALILEILTREPIPLSELAPDCPADVRAIFERAMSKDDEIRYPAMSALLASLEPLWKREQSAEVERLLCGTRESISREQYTEARKSLEYVFRLDRENPTATTLLEQLRRVREGQVLKQEIKSIVKRGWNFLEMGLFSDARREANSALLLDSNAKPARELLANVKQIEAAARRALQEDSQEEPASQREYAIQGKRGTGDRKRPFATIPLADARSVTATVRSDSERGRKPKTSTLLPLETGARTIASPGFQRRPAAFRIALIAAGALVVGLVSHRIWSHKTPQAVAEPTTTAVPSGPPAKENVESNQRVLLEEAHEAADRADYVTARARLDEAAKLDGPLSTRIQELRNKFSEEEQNAGLREIARQEADLWNAATRKLRENQLDDADAGFQAILKLGPGGRRRDEAGYYISKVIPQMREENRLLIQAESYSSSGGKETLERKAAVLDRVLAMNGPRRSEAQRLRTEVQQRLASYNQNSVPEAVTAKPSFAAPPATNESPKANTEAEAAKVNASPPRDPDVEKFQSAVAHFDKAVQQKDVAALRDPVTLEFQKLAAAKGSKSADAERYLNALIPAAIREATPWPAIGCPAVSAALSMTVKPGEIVACGMLDAPRLKWAQFVWPTVPDSLRQAGPPKTVVMLSVTVDEQGNVVEAKTRSKPEFPAYLDAVSKAVHLWKTTPPRAQGKPVRTEFAVDVPAIP